MVDSALLNYIESNNIEHYIGRKTSDVVSFKIGGVADLIVYPNSIYQLCEILIRLGDERKVVLGNGTNCYFSDKGYHGSVIVTKRIDDAWTVDNRVIAFCGASLTALSKIAHASSLTGLEFAYGIPGSLGGAVAMNASAFGGEMSNLVKSSTVFDIGRDEIREISQSEHLFERKSSVFRRGGIYLLKSELLLQRGNKDEILSKMNNNLEKRSQTQPLSLPNAGSVFVRPKNGYASQMIDMCGLKGFSVGGAMVSTKHAGFIVNAGGASACDVLSLIKIIKDRVYEKFGVELEEEIVYTE